MLPWTAVDRQSTPCWNIAAPRFVGGTPGLAAGLEKDSYLRNTYKIKHLFVTSPNIINHKVRLNKYTT